MLTLYLAGSLAGIALLVGLNVLLFGRAQPHVGTPDAVVRLLSDEIPGFRAGRCAIAVDGRAALIENDATRAIVLVEAMGDGVVTRGLSRGTVASVGRLGPQLSIDLADFTFPRAVLRMDSEALAREWEASEGLIMQLPNPTEIATPLFIVLVVVEMLFARFAGRGRYEARDTATSLLMGFFSVVSGAAFAFLFIAFGTWLARYRIADLGWSWMVFVAAFLLDDLTYYWWHRASHRIRWLWADHVQHHSSRHYNLSTALRQPVTGAFTPGLFFRAPLILLGFPLPVIAFVHGVNLVYQFWIHTEAIERFPRWIEAVMNTPSHHRVHHATNARYLDSNFAGVFIVWDRMFGTFVAEDAQDAPRYGIVKNLGSYNPLKVALHEWVGMLSDISRARSLRDALMFVFAPPGWSPDGSRETSESIKARWNAYRSASLAGE